MYTILVVEDDLNIQTKIKEILLSLDNMHVITASRGSEALKIARERAIDIFIIDIKLPDWNGINLAIELRKIYPYSPFIIESTIDVPDVRLKVYEQIGNVIYMTKPFTERDLIQKVTSVVLMIEKTNIKHLILKKEGTLWRFEIKNIIYIERIKNKKGVLIVSINETTKKLDETEFYDITLKYLLDATADKRDFLRCHKSILINPLYIKKLNYHKKFICLKYIDKEIPLGDAYKQDFIMEGNGLDGLDF